MKHKSKFLRGKRIDPAPIAKEISVADLIDESFLAYNAARLREACQLFTRKMLEPEVAIGLSATKDIDVLVRSTPENAERVYAALARFGAPLASFAVTAGDFATYDGVLQFGIAPLRADILNRIVGVTFDEAIASAESIEVDGRRIPVLGLDALLRAKRAAGRPKDLLYVTELERRRSKT